MGLFLAARIVVPQTVRLVKRRITIVVHIRILQALVDKILVATVVVFNIQFDIWTRDKS